MVEHADDLRGMLPDEIVAVVAALRAERDEIREAADDLAESVDALLAHFRRHTTHRCEIDREADMHLAAYHALAAARRPPTPHGSPSDG